MMKFIFFKAKILVMQVEKISDAQTSFTWSHQQMINGVKVTRIHTNQGIFEISGWYTIYIDQDSDWCIDGIKFHFDEYE